MLRRAHFFMLVASLCLMLAGCVKFKHQTVVMPDKSGKMTFILGINEQMASGQMEDPTDLDLADVDSDTSGFVAFTRPKQHAEGGWKYVTFVGYFEDINQVRLGSDQGQGQGQGGQPPVTYQFEQTDEGYKLVVNNSMTSHMGTGMSQQEEVDPQQRAMLEAMVQGMDIEESYTLPGKVIESGASAQIDGKVATVKLTDADVFNRELAGELAAANPRTVTAGASEVTDAAQAAWQEELAAAKAEWAAIKEELEANQTAE